MCHILGVVVVKVVVNSTVLVDASTVVVVIGCVVVCFVVIAMPVDVSSIVLMISIFSTAYCQISVKMTNTKLKKLATSQ